MSGESTPVRCSCGTVLVEVVDSRAVVVGDRQEPFSRSTDFVICEECDATHRMQDLRALLEGDDPDEA